jgi:Fe-S-cluster containining protein
MEEINPLCARCGGSCCKILSFPVKRGDEDFWKARGAILSGDHVHIPYRCPNLNKDGLCAVYANRPVACKQYRPGCRACLTAMKVVREEGL